ncbi:MAG: CRISPR-associated helicase Cas3' [Lachnospiraceae bacterium]|jgi:CRISPR-associated endonuclease/helicase Cas3|nr:CRISPR-associated helicase Cas3' [Lachnospiraceae bacterium]
MKLSREMKLIIAKSGTENKWLPLWMHAADTAGVMSELVHLRYSSLSEQCAMSFKDFKQTAILLAYLHDIGKITPLFQSQILKALPARRSVFEHYGIHNILENFINKEKSHHTKCGEAILLELGFPKGFSSVVGAHHGMPAEALLHHIENYPNHFFGMPADRKLWKGLYEEWVRVSLKLAGFEDPSEVPILSKGSEILMSGLLIMSDWLASNPENFELLDEDVILSEDEYPPNRCQIAFEKLRLPESWESYQERIGDGDFQKCFGFSMNPMQAETIHTAERCREPGLFILEAPMGTGKTEAALAVAEILAAKCHKTGLFFGLPTQATANSIFERVVKWAQLQSQDMVHGINLAHGNAEFQPAFLKLKKDSIPQTDIDGESGLVVNSFFSGGKVSLLTDFVVATVDRLLMSALRKKHVMLLHLGLSQKVVIVDECHAYDVYMNQYLDTALAWLHEYHVPVILLSATLPSDRRKQLTEAYINDRKKAFELPETDYPRLTYTDGDQVFTKTMPWKSATRMVTVICGDENMALEKMRDAVRSGACVGVICNTVVRAQHFARQARNVDGAKVILYHAQYIIPDRMKRENILIEAVGKDSDAKIREGVVVVGTQVLEQSLDIDFDILITDLCPMDLLLQRIGRLGRHIRTDRPLGYETAECIVLGTEELDSSSKRIYTEWLLLRTRKLLPSHITIPDDIDPLVYETYRAAEPDNEEEKAAWTAYQVLLKDKQQRAKSYLMARPRESKRGGDLHGWLQNSAGDSESSALATVRDGTFSIEVLVLIQYADGMLGMLPWQTDGGRYSPAICPSDDDGKRIAQQKLRLPARFCYDINRTVNELEEMDQYLTGFEKSRWLKGQLVLLLNESLSVKLCGAMVTYSQDDGLTYTKEGET